MELPQGIKRTPGSLWVRIEGDRVTVGMTDRGQEELGMILFMELPEPGDAVRRGEGFALAETAALERELKSPVTGLVLEVNRSLETNPYEIHRSPYGQGWIAVLQASDPNELKELEAGEPPEGPDGP